MPDLIIHAGLHKTGSTSIQIFCNCQKEAMRESNILYPDEWNVNGAHHALREFLIDKNEAEVMPVFERWRKKCSDDAYRSVVISSEDFELLGENGVAFLKSCADRAGFRGKGIIYMRPQSELIESQYSQQVREGAKPGTFESFIEQSLSHGRFLKIEDIASWYSRAFGDDFELVFFYDSDNSPINVLEDFTRRVGVTTVRNPQKYAFNKKLNAAQLEVIRIIVDKAPMLDELKPYERSQVLHNFIKKIEWPSEFRNQPAFTLTKEQLQKCREWYREENKRISEKYFTSAEIIDRWYENKIQVEAETIDRLPVSDIHRMGERLANEFATLAR